MPFLAIELDELRDGLCVAVFVEGQKVAFMFMLKPEGGHKFLTPCRMLTVLPCTLMVRRGKGAGCSLMHWTHSTLLMSDSLENHTS